MCIRDRNKAEEKTMVKKLAVLLLVLFIGSSAVCLPTTSATTPTITTTAPAASNVTSTRYLDYRVSLAPDQISNDTLGYFKAHGFTTVVLVAAEAIPYDKELQKIKQLGMYPILDIEVVIWNGGNNKSTPITEFDKAFATWRDAGWWNVATGGDEVATLKNLRIISLRLPFLTAINVASGKMATEIRT